MQDDVEERVALAWLVHVAGRSRARSMLAASANAVSAASQLNEAAVEVPRFRQALARTPHRLLIQSDPLFPPLLRQIPDPPLALYLAGDEEALAKPAVAVVGARRCSRTATEVAREFAAALAGLGLTVVSGLAFGVDSAAHRGAVECGRTVAVLGSGVGRIQPVANRPLAEQILRSGGAILSEYPPHQGARAYHFPERNRIISGLSAGVLVVEAGERSGSLITARMALEQGREVMAIPGSIRNPAARGCHRLLRDGAALVDSVDDILAALGLDQLTLQAPRCTEMPVSLGSGDVRLAQVLDEIGYEPTPFDLIRARTGLSAGAITEVITELELLGFVEVLAGGYIRRAAAGP